MADSVRGAGPEGAEAPGGVVDEQVQLHLDELVPHVSVDCTIFGFHAGELKILLLKWKGVDAWSLPGGYVRWDESVDEAAHRVLEVRTGLKQIYLRQFRTFGGTGRGEEALHAVLSGLGVELSAELWIFKRIVSIGYLALVDFLEATPRADHLSEEARWWDVRNRPSLLFDHDDIVASALATLRTQLDHRPIGEKLLPERFTMPELRQLHETVLGTTLDPRNFQRKILERGVVERLAERKRGVPHRAPYLYRFRERDES